MLFVSMLPVYHNSALVYRPNRVIQGNPKGLSFDSSFGQRGAGHTHHAEDMAHCPGCSSLPSSQAIAA